MLGEIQPWHIIVLLVVIFALFGYKRLPSATKSIAQSMKIFKDETKGLIHHDEPETTPIQAQPGVVSSPHGDLTGALAAPGSIPAPAPVQQTQQVATDPMPMSAPVIAPPAWAAPPAPTSSQASSPEAAQSEAAPAAQPAPAGQPSLAPRPRVTTGDQPNR